MNNRGFLNISFSWIFAFLVGGIIIFGAIYGVNKLSDVKNAETSAELGTSLGNLLIPLESGIESAKSISITLPVESKIRNECDNFGNFGSNTIYVQEKVKGKWTKSGVGISFKDKYLFFPQSLEAKKLNIFSKSFEFPFKISNLIYFSNAEEKYCFIDLPRESERDLKNLNQENLEFDDCSEGSTRVCFEGGNNCDIEVGFSSKEVLKNEEKVYFEGDALMYAAIFSDKQVYECGLKRLMKRSETLSIIYERKSINLLSVGCDSSLKTEFAEFRNSLSSFRDSRDLNFIYQIAREMNQVNKYSGCTLW